MADTPNMNLSLPVVQETLGPTYAQMNNEAFEEIDSHDHTDGKGVQVPTAGININLDLPMNGFAVTEANALSLQDVSGTPEVLSVYSDEGDLYYRNAAGTAVQLTTGDTIVGTVGSISGLGDGGSSASFSDLSEDFSWFYNGSKLAAFNIGDIRLFPFDGTTEYSNKITLKSPTTLASDYALTLPTILPASGAALVQVDSTGQLSYSNTISGSLTLTSPILAANGSDSNPTYSFSGDVDTGIRYNSGLSIVFGGSERFRIDGPQIKSARTAGSNQATPDFSFLNDPNTGIYSSAADTLNFSTGGTSRLNLSTSAFTSNVAFSGTTGTFSGAVSASTYGNAVATSLNLDGGGAFKIKIVSCGSTGSIATGSSGSATAAHGLTESNIRGVLSYAFRSGFSYAAGSIADSTSDSNGCMATTTGTNVTVSVRNHSGTTGTYTAYAIIFHV